jgi:hypothetical protein
MVLVTSSPSESFGTMVMPGLEECQCVTSPSCSASQNQNSFAIGITFILKSVLQSARCTGLSAHPALVSCVNTIQLSSDLSQRSSPLLLEHIVYSKYHLSSGWGCEYTYLPTIRKLTVSSAAQSFSACIVVYQLMVCRLPSICKFYFMLTGYVIF